MKHCEPENTGKNFEYPNETKGSKIAAEIRAKTNKLTDAERAKLFEKGMQIIYGGPGQRETVKSRH